MYDEVLSVNWVSSNLIEHTRPQQSSSLDFNNLVPTSNQKRRYKTSVVILHHV